MSAPVVLVSGIPGAGKSTVSTLLAKTWERAVVLESDRVGEEFIVSGAVLPGQAPADESERQLALRRRHLCFLAASFADAGFHVVVDDVILWPGLLDTYRSGLQARELRFVLLTPDLATIKQRDAGRHKHVFDMWAHLAADLDAWIDAPGLRIDSTELTAEQTVAAIVDGWDDALIG